MKSKCIITSFLLLLLAISAFCQNWPKPLNNLIKKLKKEGADTILIYISGCNGCEIKDTTANCSFFHNKGISDVILIFKNKGEFTREYFSCGRVNYATKIKGSLSIPYFLDLRTTLTEKAAYYKKEIKAGHFLPPIPTDSFYEDVTLIAHGRKYSTALSSSQLNENYDVWKKYFWIDKEIKLISLIRKDVGLHVSHTSIPID